MPGTKLPPLLCELHSHTTWSDGDLSLRELVDLHGRNGFDVLCITDHVVRSDDRWLLERMARGASVFVDEHRFDAYLDAVENEASRARSLYGLLVVPGIELTYNDDRPEVAAHAVAVGLRRFVSADQALEHALDEARGKGAALIAVHPHGDESDPIPGRTTQRFWREADRLAPLVDRFELFNRHQLFGWVAEAGLPAVANGDFHHRGHLATWKTLLPCEKSEPAIVDYLRSRRPAYLTRLDLPVGALEQAAEPALLRASG